MATTKLFLSHSSKDDDFIRQLRQALADFGQEVWIDSRQLRGGDPLWPDIQNAIAAATTYAVLVSPAALQSKWVGKELQHAVKLREQRGRANYPVIPFSLDNCQLGVLETLMGEEPVYLPISSAPGGIDAALNKILEALGLRLPADLPRHAQLSTESLEELILELTDLKFQEQDGKRRATARARLSYQPTTPGAREVNSPQSWRLVAPLGPIEAEELRWYLEKYAIWPGSVYRERAGRVEANLVEWGRALHQAALPANHTGNVLQAWARAIGARRFSVLVDASVEAGAPEEEGRAAREASTQLLSLPWELLHDGGGYLFQGAKPVRVRRRLPNSRDLNVAVLRPPIRILLASPRPEDDACGYIDHRASALPLVDAVEALGGLVQLHLLTPPTYPALGMELARARKAGQPYHVVHFDGHGTYDRNIGLGGLCFEQPQDTQRIEGRRHQTIHTDQLGPLLRDQRIPLVFLEACQTAQAEQASDSVASELLKVGVASVVAMSHSVLVETSRRFVAAFYAALAEGARVGDAMLAGQTNLHDDSFRGRVFGVGDFRLRDWFVPVLFQEREDPQLFTATPAPETQEITRTRLRAKLGELPPCPATGFIGRSRELLALERLLLQEQDSERYAVLRGQGGEGKTALAVEFARWQVRSQRVERAAFVSLERDGHTAAVLNALGPQLAGSNFPMATSGEEEPSLQHLERALREQETLLVLDNLESVLPPPYLETPKALSEDAREQLTALLALCQRLLQVGNTRIVFTSREALPAPFAGELNRIELARLSREDAVKLVERALNQEPDSAAADARQQDIEDLVDAVHGHARSLTLLAPDLHLHGVVATHARLLELMADLDRRFPGQREKSLYASVELSLTRLSPQNRERVKVLGVFHGEVDLDVLCWMMGWEKADVAALAGELLATGLATPDPYDHLSLDPALCPTLRARMEEAEREELSARWEAAMGSYVRFLVQQRNQKAEMAATLTGLELANLFALLERARGVGDAAATITLATALYRLLQMLGKPRLLQRVGQVRDEAAAALGEAWSHAHFGAARTRSEQQGEEGPSREALAGAQALLQRSRAAGEQAYAGAAYDLAGACFLLARVLETAGGSDRALPLLEEARQRFEAFEVKEPGRGAEGMASVCLGEQGNCLLRLGRLDEAATVYEEALRRAEKWGAERSVAVGQVQLGTVWLQQHRYAKALVSYEQAREHFQNLDEPGSVATAWHQIGMVHQESGRPDAAEAAYRKALKIKVRLSDVAGQADTLVQLGNLYDGVLQRPEEAVAFTRQAADKYVEIGDVAGEGLVRNNLAETLRKLRRLDEARREIQRAIECKAAFGHAARPWTSWAILAAIETDAGNLSAAAEAKRQAITAYLAYRRDGGENQFGAGRLCLAITQALLADQPDAAVDQLRQEAARYEASGYGGYIHALQSLVAGQRDPALAAALGLTYDMSAEILFLIETLERPT